MPPQINEYVRNTDGVKEPIHIILEHTSLNRGGGLRSSTYNVVLSSLPRQLTNYSNFNLPSPNNPHEGQLGQRLASDSNSSEFQEFTHHLID